MSVSFSVQNTDRSWTAPKNSSEGRGADFKRERAALDDVVVRIAERILDNYLPAVEYQEMPVYEVSSIVDAIVFQMEKDPDSDLCSAISELIQQQPDGSRNALVQRLKDGVTDYIFRELSNNSV